MPSRAEVDRLLTGAARVGLAEAAGAVLELAKHNAPVGAGPADSHPGELRDSGHVTVERAHVIVEFDTPYAAKQHEALHYQHPQGGEAKYLEKALLAALPKLEAIVASEVHKRFERR